MKINNLIKFFPVILTFFIITLLSINNQKENTKLKILIWNTPSLSLGTYLSISTGSGFLLSYIITTNIANFKHSKMKNIISYKDNSKGEDIKQSSDNSNEKIYYNTLIERDVKDPSPTIKASFRVVGKTNRNNIDPEYYENNESNSSDYSNEIDDFYDNQKVKYENDLEINPAFNDWNDDSYTSW